MAGQIKKMLDQIIETRSRGDSFLALTTKTKLVMKGISPDKYDYDSPDNPWVIKDVRRIAEELDVTLQEEPMAIKPVYSMETSPEKNAADLAAHRPDRAGLAGFAPHPSARGRYAGIGPGLHGAAGGGAARGCRPGLRPSKALRA